ncbi:MAG: hypothetical protein B7X48_12385 [Acidiphilium sp. 34-60-192]|nr:MAG: hypothetical protein B7X48_12385 [Acidiphilium sp. 34-60-192]
MTALLVVFAPVAYAPVAAAQTMPPAIGKPLLAAEEDLNAHRYADALALISCAQGLMPAAVLMRRRRRIMQR